VNETTKKRIGATLKKLGFKKFSKKIKNGDKNAVIKVWAVKPVDHPEYIDDIHKLNDVDESPSGMFM